MYSQFNFLTKERDRHDSDFNFSSSQMRMNTNRMYIEIQIRLDHFGTDGLLWMTTKRKEAFQGQTQGSKLAYLHPRGTCPGFGALNVLPNSLFSKYIKSS